MEQERGSKYGVFISGFKCPKYCLQASICHGVLSPPAFKLPDKLSQLLFVWFLQSKYIYQNIVGLASSLTEQPTVLPK